MASFPIRIHPLFWLLALLIGWLNSTTPAQIFVWVVIIFLSVLIHEAGHALAGITFHQKVRIELAPFGGVTYREGPKLSLGKEFIVVLAGPLFGFCLFILGFFWLPHIEDEQSLLFFGVKILMIVNLLWTILNLLPIIPLDGGHLLRIILEKLFGFKGVKGVHYISFVLATLLTMLSFGLGQLFLGVLFFLLAFTSLRALKQVNQMSIEDQDVTVQEGFESAEKKLLMGNKKEALEEFAKLREQCHEGMIHNIATETEALLMLEDLDMTQEKKKKIYDLLCTVPKLSLELIPTFHRLAYESGDPARAKEYAEEAYQISPTPETALINAMAHAALREIKPAIGWLECALSEGNFNIKEVIEKKDFDQIRDTEPFKKFIVDLK